VVAQAGVVLIFDFPRVDVSALTSSHFFQGL
jgi:hypothetical protein